MSATGAISGGGTQLAWQVNMAVAKKTLDAAKSQGDAAVSLLQAAADLQQQTLPDTAGKGGRIDVTG